MSGDEDGTFEFGVIMGSDDEDEDNGFPKDGKDTVADSGWWGDKPSIRLTWLFKLCSFADASPAKLVAPTDGKGGAADVNDEAGVGDDGVDDKGANI